MAKAQETGSSDVVENLFDKALSDPETIPSVSKYVKTGRRWDSKHGDYLGKLIILKGFRMIRTTFGERALVELDAEGEQRSVLFGSEVLTEQMQELGERLPVLAQIKKSGRAYLLFDPTPEMIAEYKEKYM